MPACKTKSFSRKEVSLPLLLTLGGLGVLTLVYASGFFSLTTASNAGSIQANDRVTVDGVNNTTQYLTSMVLHAPGTNEKVTLNYDPVLNALRIKGAVNADGLIIGNNEASVGNTILGGTNNQATEGTNTNSLIVGGESNKLNDASNSAIIGGQNNTLLNTENVAVIGSSQTTFPVGEKRENIFIVGGTGNQVKGSNVFILGEGENVAGSDMVLMGKRIKAWEKGQLFVWSDEDQDFFPQRSNAFYVNTTKGIGLNTNDPKVKFDAGQAGGVRIGITASKVINCSPNYAGVMAYVHVGGKSGFCGCNGQVWVPLTADPSIQAVCINMQKSPCAGPEPLNANKGATLTLPVWNPDADNGNGAFIPKSWSYTNANPKAECSYDCIIGFHPGENNPEGKHPNGACKPCSHFSNRYVAGANNGWKSAGKWNDNCDFSCIGGARYQNTASQRACPLCSTGKSIATLVSKISGNTHYDKAWYSPDDNQLATCSECTNKPVNAKYTQKDVNSATGACPWECADGYNKRGNDCLKATWKEKRTKICKTSPGRWKDAYEEITYECRDTSGGLVNDTRICDVWERKPNDEERPIADEECNTPSWVTLSCDQPHCTGKCSSDQVQVNCTQEYRDRSGKSHGTRTVKEYRRCSWSCEGWSCNITNQNVDWADNVWPDDSLLCSQGRVKDKSFNPDPNVYQRKWTWKCEGHSTTTPVSCRAHKKNQTKWACDTVDYQCKRNGEGGNIETKPWEKNTNFVGGKQWTCDQDVICTTCNPGFNVETSTTPAQCVKQVQKVNACFYPAKGRVGISGRNFTYTCVQSNNQRCIKYDKGTTLNLRNYWNADFWEKPNNFWGWAKENPYGQNQGGGLSVGNNDFILKSYTLNTDTRFCGVYDEYKCIGSLPDHAKWASRDEEINLKEDTNIAPAVNGINNPDKKCEYTCESGYTFDNGRCVKEESYHWECFWNCVSTDVEMVCKWNGQNIDPTDECPCEDWDYECIQNNMQLCDKQHEHDQEQYLCSNYKSEYYCLQQQGCSWEPNDEAQVNGCEENTTENICSNTEWCKWHLKWKKCVNKSWVVVQDSYCSSSPNITCEKEEEPKVCSPIPKNAEFYLGDDQNLTSNTKSKYSEINNSDQKCEWKCKKNYLLKEGKCKTLKKRDWKWNPFEWEIDSIYIRDADQKKPKLFDTKFRVGTAPSPGLSDRCTQIQKPLWDIRGGTSTPRCIVRYNPQLYPREQPWDKYYESKYRFRLWTTYFVICWGSHKWCSFEILRRAHDRPDPQGRMKNQWYLYEYNQEGKRVETPSYGFFE